MPFYGLVIPDTRVCTTEAIDCKTQCSSFHLCEVIRLTHNILPKLQDWQIIERMTNWQVIRDSMKKTGHCGYSPEDWRELRMLEAMRREHSKLGHNIQRGCDGLTAYEKCLECNYEYAVSVWNP